MAQRRTCVRTNLTKRSFFSYFSRTPLTPRGGDGRKNRDETRSSPDSVRRQLSTHVIGNVTGTRDGGGRPLSELLLGSDQTTPLGAARTCKHLAVQTLLSLPTRKRYPRMPLRMEWQPMRRQMGMHRRVRAPMEGAGAVRECKTCRRGAECQRPAMDHAVRGAGGRAEAHRAQQSVSRCRLRRRTCGRGESRALSERGGWWLADGWGAGVQRVTEGRAADLRAGVRRAHHDCLGVDRQHQGRGRISRRPWRTLERAVTSRR